jgi:alkylation response protein AidB-like acyl-CoA dehydrogenase
MIMGDDLIVEFEAVAEEVLSRLMARDSVREDVIAHGFSTEAWKVVAEAGWFSTLLDEADGGLGLSLQALAPMFRAAGRHLLPGPLLEHAVAAPLAAPLAADDARARLRQAARGERRVALADGLAAPPGPVLERGSLSGNCRSVRFAATAHDVLVIAETRSGGTAMALVPRTRRGLGVHEQRSLDPSSSIAEVVFDNVSVDSNDQIGGACTGPAVQAQATRMRTALRLMIACTLAGIAGRVLQMSVSYARERQQFGRAIGSFQATQHRLADMARCTIGLDSLCGEALAASSGPHAATAALVAKARAGRVARHVIDGALQVHGGIAFTVEHSLHRYYKHVLTLECLYGMPGDLEVAIGNDLLTSRGDPWPAW